MNKVVIVGRLTRDPDIRWTQGQDQKCIARYTLAVDRKFKTENGPSADFIPCVVFGRSAEFTEKYFRQGMRISISGHIQTGSYTNKDGVKIYTTDIVVEEQEFAESKAETLENSNKRPKGPEDVNDGFMNVPEDIDDEELPFA